MGAADADGRFKLQPNKSKRCRLTSLSRLIFKLMGAAGLPMEFMNELQFFSNHVTRELEVVTKHSYVLDAR